MEFVSLMRRRIMVLGIIVSVNKVTQDNIVRSDKKIMN